jgi:hypothetical protein
MKTLGLAAAVGVILGIAMLWWIRPDTNAGAVVIVVTTTLLCFIIGVIWQTVGRWLRTRFSRGASS